MNGIAFLLLSCFAPWCMGVDSDPGPDPQPAAAQTVAEKKARPSSPAERIARLQAAIADAKKHLEEHKKKLEDPEGEYYQALEKFQQLDDDLKALRKKMEELDKQGKKEEVEDLQEDYKRLLDRHQLGKERFNLAIQERKMLQQRVNTLPEKIRQDEEALDELLGRTRPKDKNETTPSAKKKQEDEPSPDSSKANVKDEDPADGQKAASSPEPPGSPQTKAAGDLVNGAKALVPKGITENKALQKAQQEADAKEMLAEKARDKAETITKRLDTLNQNIELDKSLLETAQQRVALLRKVVEGMEKEHQRLLVIGGDKEEIKTLRDKLTHLRGRLTQTRDEVRNITDHLVRAQDERSELLMEQHRALEEAAYKRQKADRARQRVEELQNPFTINNVLQWLLDSGPQIVVILVAMIFLRLLIKLLSRQLVNIISKSGRRFSIREAENRAQTLASIFTNMASLMILGGGTLMILDTLGLPIIPLMGGAAVFGLAVAFGAQNLIRDYFTGFMVLLEDQYGINDVVKIGDIRGQVERITLRMTVIRDLEGIVHFVPHGTIQTVSNMTHGWSVALFDIGVAYKENADYVIQILEELCKEIRQDPDYGPLILQDADMLGVDKFSDSAIVIKFTLRTRPLKQWRIKRELLRRIKNRFDMLGIEIPFPHRTIYHHHETNSQEDRDMQVKAEKHVA